ncbi:hypothetical protein Nepgr_024403 [Nepenthes gracilis]|uniref:ENTH domain-containing protein n=1 Tax=Nepenthes gracilis TaxID=150966 RepID=A0AAD3Y011_NEPGR|nr:hypothetical protein Nepgr_024403 [Nepenthes gracilis]
MEYLHTHLALSKLPFSVLKSLRLSLSPARPTGGIRPKIMRNLVGILKDKISLIKATVLLSKQTATYHIAVLRATTHDPTPPPDYSIDDVLSLGHHSLPTASAIVNALLTRLHTTNNAYVALKCLFTIHNIIARGSSVLKDQIADYPFPNGHNFLNLSTFRDNSDSESWELSSWVRWYADVIEQSLINSRILGFYISSPLSRIDSKEQILGLSSPNLLNELETLVSMMEQICRAPESLHYQRISIVYEIMRLVCEDYRLILREIFTRLSEFGARIERLSVDELNELLLDVIKLEDCRGKLSLIFMNKKKNNGVWDLLGEMKANVGMVKERKENMRLVTFEGRRRKGSASTRIGQEVAESRRLASPAS